jgi:hypothetical protein
MLHVGNIYSACMEKIFNKYNSMYIRNIFLEAQILLEEMPRPEDGRAKST